MQPDGLKSQIQIEFAQIEKVGAELQNLANEMGDSEPRLRDKAAAGAFLAQIYGGLENVLKRILRYNQVELPKGEDWHMQLLRVFRKGENKSVPNLLDDSLQAQLAPYRKFRHVVMHSYGFELEWNRMLPGIRQIPCVLGQFKSAVDNYLRSIP